MKKQKNCTNLVKYFSDHGMQFQKIMKKNDNRQCNQPQIHPVTQWKCQFDIWILDVIDFCGFAASDGNHNEYSENCHFV